MRQLCIPFLLLLAAALPAVEVAVVNPSINADALKSEQIRDLLRGKRMAWDDGTKVVVVLSRDQDADRALMRFLDLSSQQFRIAWKKLVFTGKATMPQEVDNAEQLVDYVARNRGAIGVVDKDKVKDGVKVITLE